jgi:CRP/FNR family transcriptional regulator, cyclic AMP receptor protein
MGNTSEEDLRFLSLVDIFEPLCPEEVEALGRESPEVRLRAGEILYAPADRCESLLVLERSRVRPYRETLEGREFTLAVIEGGTILGEESPTSRRSRNAYAEGVEESEVAVLARADLEALIRNTQRGWTAAREPRRRAPTRPA